MDSNHSFIFSYWIYVHVESQIYFEIPENVSTQLLPYNYESIMHLPCRAYSMNGLLTIVPKEVHVHEHIFQGYPSARELDYLHLNILYCNGECMH